MFREKQIMPEHPIFSSPDIFASSEEPTGRNERKVCTKPSSVRENRDTPSGTYMFDRGICMR